MSASDWPSVRLGDCVVINDDAYSPKEAWEYVNYLDTGNITENRIAEIQRIDTATDKLPSRARRKVQPGDIVYSTVRPNQRHFGIIKDPPENFLASTGFAVMRGKPDIADTNFVYWYLSQDHIVEQLHTIAEHSTSAYPSIRPADIGRLELQLPPLGEQRRIAGVLGGLDDKIELNRRMAQTLEQVARALFRSWFVDFEPVRAKQAQRWSPGQSLPGLPAQLHPLFPDRLEPSPQGPIPQGWRVVPLDEIATFRNGLALQKFPAQGPDSLPAIKIAQLRAGHTERADPVSPDIPSEYVVNDGDILFSWSGSLELVVWAGGKGALNQHLFKVEPLDNPDWFVYHWVERHLPEFRQIAADKATTMGHIKRHHLTDALVAVPPSHLLGELDSAMASPLAQANAAHVASRQLAEMRDRLLRHLVSSKMDVEGSDG